MTRENIDKFKRRLESAEILRDNDVNAAITGAQTAVDILNSIGEGVALLDPTGIITTVNPAFETFTDLARNDVVGKNLRTIIPQLLEGDDLAMLMRAIEDVAKGGTPTLSHVVLRRNTVSPIIISPAVTWIRSPKGTHINAVLTLKDVTELHQTNELLNKIFDNTHMQIVYLDTRFNYIRVNRTYAEACGHELDFFADKNYFDLYSNPENEAIFREVRDTGKPFAVHEQMFKCPDQPDSEVTYWDWSLRPIRRDNGMIEGILFCRMDVTERVRTRRKLVESEHKYRELVENANSIIMRITPDHRILFFNEYAQHFFGYSTEEILGRSVIGTIAPLIDSEGRNLLKMTKKITAHPELHGSNENENIRKDGRRVWIHWSNRAIRDKHGAVREILCVGTDVTERRKLEREALAYRRRLQRLADRLAATEEEERRNIATHIHDTVVQTLSLSNIRLGGVSTELEGAGMTEQREKVESVRQLLDQGIKECRGLMEDLVPALLYEVGINAALRDFARKQSKLTGISIRVDEADCPKPIDDTLAGLLFQCARELIMNAEKHAKPGEIRVSVSYTNEHIELRVQDNGRGFDPAELDEAKHNRTDGGFGLFNIRGRLHGLNGRLDINSAPGKGTIATIQTPLKTDS